MRGSNKLSKFTARTVGMFGTRATSVRGVQETERGRAEASDALREDVLGDVIRSLEGPMEKFGAELERLGRLSDSVCCCAEEIEDSILNAKNSLREILRLSDAFSGECEFHHMDWTEISLKEFLKGITEQLRPQFQSSGVELKEDFGHLAASIECQPDQISLALRSLLVNAAEAASMSNSIGLDWDAWVELGVHDLGHEVEITVSNSGSLKTGRDRSVLDPNDECVFETVQGALFRRELTLGNLRRVVDAHRGSLEAEREGFASFVRIRLPITAVPGVLN